MKLHSKQGHAALMFAVAGAAVIGSGVQVARATAFSTTTQTDTLIESTNFAGTTRLTAEGETSGAAASFFDYSLLQFSTTTLLPTSTQATSFNSLTLNLVDKAESFARSGLVDVYLTDFTGSPTTLTYQTAAAAQPQGIGTIAGNLFSLGQINYQTSVANTTTGTVSTAGVAYTASGTSITLSAAAQSFILNQINTGGSIGIILADDAPNVAADFEGSNGTATLAKPSLSLDVNTAAITTSNSTLTINGGTHAQTVVIPRIMSFATSNTTITVTNSGTDPGIYSATGSAAGGAGTLNAAATATVGVEPVPAGGTSSLIVGISPTNITPGQPTADAPAVATVTIHNQSKTGDTDSVVTIQAQQVVASRLIDNVGATANVVQYGKVLAGTSAAPVNVTLDTENTNSADLTSNSLTTVELTASSFAGTLQGTSTANTAAANSTVATDTGTLAAGSDTLFNDGSVTTTRSVAFTAGSLVGGLYQTKAFYDGYLSIPLVNQDTALGATTNPTARVYMEADVYQQASVSGASSGTVYSLTNAIHTTNNVGTALGDIGARSLAQVTSVSLTGQAGYNLAGTIAVGTQIADGASVVAANFTSAGKWNGVYTGTLLVGLENDQTITGATPNDLGTKSFTISTTVSGNSGNASVNILPGGSFAGYSIPSGLAKNSTVSLLGGTSTSGNTISAAWSSGTSASALSDQVTLTRTAADTFVVQMTYDPTAVTTTSANSPELAIASPTAITKLAVIGDAGGAGAETIGAYDGVATLGRYGIDPVNHVVWAVVDHVGNFEAFQRKLGDANGDGTVDVSDLTTVLNNLGTTTALWSKGNFDGAATIDLNDLNAVLNNLNTSLPAGAISVDVAEALSTGVSPMATPEPTTLGIAGLGAAGVLLRRKSRTSR